MASSSIDGLPTKSLKLASNFVVSSIQFLASMPRRFRMGGILLSMWPRLSSRITLPVNSTSSKYSVSLNGKPSGMSLRGLPANGIRDFTCWFGWLIVFDFFAFSVRLLMEVWADCSGVFAIFARTGFLSMTVRTLHSGPRSPG
jgi:hypothetical protein